MSWVVQPHLLPKRYLYEKLAVGAAEQTVTILPSGRMMMVARQCSCANAQPQHPQLDNPFKCVGNRSTSCEYAVSYSDNGHVWSPLSTLTGAGSVCPTLVRFGQRTLLSGGRRGAFVWELTAAGRVQASYNIRSLHDAAVKRFQLPRNWEFSQQNQTFPEPLDDGESSSYMSMLRISDVDGLIVYDQLANNWAGPRANITLDEYPRTEDRVFAMRFRLKADDLAAKKAAKVLRTRASFFIEPEAMLSRQSPLHDVLWDGVNRVKAPATMYSPWAPYPHYAVG